MATAAAFILLSNRGLKKMKTIQLNDFQTINAAHIVHALIEVKPRQLPFDPDIWRLKIFTTQFGPFTVDATDERFEELCEDFGLPVPAPIPAAQRVA